MTLTTDRMLDKLTFLYGQERGAACRERLLNLLDSFRASHPHFLQRPSAPDERLTELDVILITYADSLWEPDTPALKTLHTFLYENLAGVVSTLHILPFFPYSSDDGFSVMDYLSVNPALGSWDDIDRLNRDFKLMFDAVINHVSAHSAWFESYVAGVPAFRDFFITVDPAADLSTVVRPRALPLLTPVETKWGVQYVWTTFSSDQIDLNYSNPDVLLKIVEVLLFYVEHGASLIRLDAIAYLWKKTGTSCIHLKETHTVVQLFRDILDYVSPAVALITETNVPHEENVSYFGDGTNEAQLVYQFTLPPLLLHTFGIEDATALSQWAAGLENVSASTAFFNFTASHDGIGVRPVEGILSRQEIDALVLRARAHGGDVSFKTNGDGTRSPYELNVNYFDALSNPSGGEPLEVQARRFLASQAIQLAFMGVPGIYIHSLLGSRNWNEGVTRTGRLRSINREKLSLSEVEAALVDPASLRSMVFHTYRALISKRTAEKAFHPSGPQQVLALHPAAFSLLRSAPDGSEHIVAIHNVAHRGITIDLSQVPLEHVGHYQDLISGATVDAKARLAVMPYQVLWLKARDE
jgi:sucrose phosphorylase